MIATKVRSLLEGDVWFKRHFAVLVVSVLGGTMKNGYANQLVFHNFEDVDEIKNLNWCKFVLECLVERHAQWVHNPDKQFSGPIVFLLLLYVDRVVHSDRVVPHLVPSLRGWSSRHLKARQLSEIQSGGFGRGIVEGHLVVATNHEEDATHGGRHSHGHTTVVKTAAEEFADKSVALGKALDDMNKSKSITVESDAGVNSVMKLRRTVGLKRYKKRTFTKRKIINSPRINSGGSEHNCPFDDPFRSVKLFTYGGGEIGSSGAEIRTKGFGFSGGAIVFGSTI
nr:uncharacterized protein LOC109190399 [Ipomoea batatas]